jgi:uncharacterized protein (TIGR02246 family)
MTQAISAVDQHDLNEIVDGLTDAWNRHDARAFTARVAPDAEWINVLGQVMDGKAEIEKEHTAAFSTFLRNSSLDIQARSFKLIRPDVALGRLTWKTTDDETPNHGRPIPTRNGFMITVLTNERGRWSIVRMHNTDYSTMARRMTES